MSNESSKRNSNGQGVDGLEGAQRVERGEGKAPRSQRVETEDTRDGLDIPSGHEADTGDGEEEAINSSPNTGDRRPGGN